ncbi:MAG: OmpA family protein [Pseudomonadota bacterium]
MKNLRLVLSFVCGLLIAFFSPAVCAIEYRYVSPARSAVEIDMSVLGEEEQGQNVQPTDFPTAVPLPAVTAIPLDLDTEAPPMPSPPQMRVPMPEKRLLKPFFTAPSEPSAAAFPAGNLERADSTAKTDEEPEEAKIAAPSAFSELTLEFEAASSEISPTAQRKLDALVAQMNADPDMRVQIRAYAGEDSSGQRGARRMALSRGLMVRATLTDKGIKPTRLDIRALGSETGKTQPDRVDIVFAR